MATVCPHCSGPIFEDRAATARTVECPHCGWRATIPALEAASQSAQEASLGAGRESDSPPGGDYEGVYINLDRSTGRRARLEAQLQRYSLLDKYRRFPAVDGSLVDRGTSPLRPGEIGCFLSHYEAVRQHLGRATHLHVIEDDLLLCNRTEEVLRSLIGSGAVDAYDVLYTDVFLALEVGQIGTLKRLLDRIVARHGPVDADSFHGFTILELKGVWFASMMSYLVNKSSLAKLVELYSAEIQRGISSPVDIFLRDMAHAGQIRAGCIFPFVTSVHLEDIVATTMPDRHPGQSSVIAANVLRHSFYIHCDWELCRSLMQKIYQPKPPSAHEELILNIVSHKLFGDYRQF